MSAAETLRWTLARASSKSHMATGSFEISSLDMFLISSLVFPAIFRLIPFSDASRQTFVRSSPLYPSVLRATSSMFTSEATCSRVDKRWWSNDWNGYHALYLRTIFYNTTKLTKYSEEERKGMKNIGTRKHSKIPVEHNVRQRRTLNGRLQV